MLPAPAPDAEPPAPDAGPPLGTPQVHVMVGLARDLDAAIGANSLGDRAIGDKVHVLAGYDRDYITLDHVGNIGPPFGQAAAPGTPLVLSLSGSGDFAPARLLYDSMVNGPRSGDADTGTRDSPGGRVHCAVKASQPEASCSFTGVIGAYF